MQELETEEQPRVIPTVPVDESQRQCALSGERFETVWDAESEEWHYLGTVRLSAEEAARCIKTSSTSKVFPMSCSTFLTCPAAWKVHACGCLRARSLQAGFCYKVLHLTELASASLGAATESESNASCLPSNGCIEHHAKTAMKLPASDVTRHQDSACLSQCSSPGRSSTQ